ncbi:MAG: HAD-IB family phosphatase, partial [Duncaniella sp.]|nr:HAD-IB family phosphatase [Duncaniella sp.]
MEKRHITVFDFDGTLTRDDTFLSFARHALPVRRLIAGSLRSLDTLIAWKTGRITNSAAKERIYSALYKELDRKAIEKAAATFRPRYREEILSALKKLRDEGQEVIIVTASLDLWMNEIARSLGVRVLCTETSTAPDGTLTGHFSTPNCHGPEKVARLRQAVPDLASCHL